MTKYYKIPSPTIERLALYSRPLEALLGSAPPVISSERLAGLCGVRPAQVRKDLAYFGEFGVRGVGYDVRALLQEIKKILATDREWTLCIVGMGNLGSALVENENFRNAIKDFDTEKFKAHDRRIKRDVKFLLDNLSKKFGYTLQGANEVCIYVIDNDLPNKFK